MNPDHNELTPNAGIIGSTHLHLVIHTYIKGHHSHCSAHGQFTTPLSWLPNKTPCCQQIRVTTQFLIGSLLKRHWICYLVSGTQKSTSSRTFRCGPMMSQVISKPTQASTVLVQGNKVFLRLT